MSLGHSISFTKQITYEAASIKFFSMWGSSFLTRTSKPVTFCNALKEKFVSVAMLAVLAKQNLHGDVFELRLDIDRLPTHDHDDLLLIVQHVHLRV